MSDPREVLLRPEFAQIYEEIPPGVWMPAREVAERLVQRASRARRSGVQRRTLVAQHFEFRGGAHDTRREGARTRRTDHPGGGPEG
jgi:hypothetical protein